MSALQRRLLARALDLVVPGGVLVWCTCSLQPEEGESQIVDVLGQHAGFRRLPITAGDVAGLSEILTSNGEVRSLPCHAETWGGLDGFHISRLQPMR